MWFDQSSTFDSAMLSERPITIACGPPVTLAQGSLPTSTLARVTVPAGPAPRRTGVSEFSSAVIRAGHPGTG